MSNEIKGFIAAAGLVLFSFGFAIGLLQMPEPEVQTVEKKVVVTEAVAPTSCVIALNAADEVIQLSGKALRVSGKAVASAADLNLDAVLRHTDALTDLSPDLKRPLRVYDKASDSCRTKARES